MQDHRKGIKGVRYDWDHRNRLTLIIFLNGSGAETKRVEYEYNVDNLRIAKRVSTDGGTTWDIQRYALDGSDVVLVFDKNENVEHTYFHGPAVDQIFADENATGEILWALSDHQGTVRDWIDADDASTNSSAPTQHVEYSAFGEILAATDEATLPSYSYTGREWDADAELYYYRNRWYDPVIGKFANDDPIGFAAGDSNLQRYVGNSSPNAVDPDGLMEFDFSAVVWNGHQWWLDSLPPTGGHGADLAAADAWMKEFYPDFPGYKALGATWHHKSFDGATGTFVMELVDQAEHASKFHSGGIAQYLDWMADVIGGSPKKLTQAQQEALFRGLSNNEMVDRLLKQKRLGGKLITRFQVSIVKRQLEKAGWSITVKKGGKVVTKFVAKQTGRGAAKAITWRVIKGVGAAGATTVFVLWESGKAYATTGNYGQAMRAGAREVTQADLVEGGIRLVVVEGGKIAESEFLDLHGHLRQKYRYLPNDERDKMMRQSLREWQKFYESYDWDQFNREIDERIKADGGYGRSLLNSLRNVLFSDEYKE